MTQMIEQGGGQAATAMAAVARLGGQAAIVGRVGADRNGQNILSAFDEAGVDRTGVRAIEEATSQFAICIIHDPTGQRSIFYRDGTMGKLQPDEVDPDLVARAADVGLERSAYLRTHAHVTMFTLAATVNTIFMAYDPDSLVVGGGVGTAPGFFEALMDSVASIRSRSAVANEFVNPHQITVLASDDPIATESALVLAAQAEASSRETIVA